MQPSEGPALNTNVVGRRIIAAIIDFAIVLAFNTVMTVLFGDTESDDGGFSFQLTGAPALIVFVVGFAYFIVLEALLGGRTVGKMLTGVKVVSLSGGPISFGQSLVRNLLRIVDYLPCIPLVGLIMILANSNHRRVGDLVAKTAVVKS